MPNPKSPAQLSIAIAATALVAFTSAPAAELIPAACPAALHEARIDLEESLLLVDLHRSTFAAREEIYELIADLVQDDAVDRMTYLKARYKRDAAKLALERADLMLLRQEALIEQIRLACDGGPDGELQETNEERESAMESAYLRYRQADCEQQSKAIEVATTALEFNRQWLASVRDLRSQVSTRPDVILAQLDVTHEEQRRDDALRRTESCRAELKLLQASAEPSTAGGSE